MSLWAGDRRDHCGFCCWVSGAASAGAARVSCWVIASVLLSAGPGANTRISGHGACRAMDGEMPSARSVSSSSEIPYRTPWSLIHHMDSRLVASGAAPVVITRLVAPGDIYTWSASMLVADRSFLTSCSNRLSDPMGMGSPLPDSTRVSEARSVDPFDQFRQVTGLDAVSTSSSRVVG